MKLKTLILLLLFGALLVSAGVNTLSEYNTATSFSVGVTADKEKMKGNNSAQILSVDSANLILTGSE